MKGGKEMKKILGSISFIFLILCLFGCNNTVKTVRTTFAGSFSNKSTNDDICYIFEIINSEDDYICLFFDEDTKIYDIEGNLIKEHIDNRIDAFYGKDYLVKIQYDTAESFEVDYEEFKIAYKAKKIEPYLEVLEGYAIGKFYHFDENYNKLIAIHKLFEVGKPWIVKPNDFVEYDYLVVPNFHVIQFYLDKKRQNPISDDIFNSFPEDGISLYLEATTDIQGSYLSDDGNYQLLVDSETFTILDGDEETIYTYKHQYYLGHSHLLCDENDEVIAYFGFYFNNFDNFITITNYESLTVHFIKSE